MRNTISINNILNSRISPYLWYIAGYFTGICLLLNYNHLNASIYYSLFGIYKFANMFFDIFTVTFDFEEHIKPFHSITIYDCICITKKKYKLTFEPYMRGWTTDEEDPVEFISIKNYELIEISLYFGNNCAVKHILYLIYLLGLTKKNYTMNVNVLTNSYRNTKRISNNNDIVGEEKKYV